MSGIHTGTQAASPPASPGDVLDFWLSDGVQLGWPTQDLGKRWFGGGEALDDTIKTRFGELVVLALQGNAGRIDAWRQMAASPALGVLAQVLLLDQFTRNVFRGQVRAFSGDIAAQQLVLNALADQLDQQLPWVGRVFVYMPLMHAENMALQNECVDRFEQLWQEAPPELKARLQGNLDFAREHRGIIEKFGRFPYRNGVMGRTSTAEEAIFLETRPRFGQ